MWQLPESELQILGDVAGKDVLEYGCGAAQWSILLARRGARLVGLDNSARQLEHARELMAEAGVDFPLVHAGAEQVPLADATFDVVFCDHGAMTFADPYLTVPEVARLLRPGGLFAFSHSTPLRDLLLERGRDDRARGSRPYFGMHRFDDAATSRSSSTCRTASGSGSSARTASWSRRCSRSSRRRAPSRPTGAPRRPSGRGRGRWRRSGRCRKT